MPHSRRSLGLALISTVVSLSLPVGADPAADARKSIQAAYDSVSVAVEKRDIKGVTAFYTPDFQTTQRDGRRITLAEERRQIQMMFLMMKNIKATQIVQTLTLKGNLATVTAKTHMEGIMFDPDTKRSHKFAGDNISLDSWVKGSRGWMLKNSRTLNERTLLDDKPQQ